MLVLFNLFWTQTGELGELHIQLVAPVIINLHSAALSNTVPCVFQEHLMVSSRMHVEGVTKLQLYRAITNPCSFDTNEFSLAM